MKKLNFILVFSIISIYLLSSVSAYSIKIIDLNLAFKRLNFYLLNLFGITSSFECTTGYDCCTGGGLWWGCNYGMCDPCAAYSKNCVQCSPPTTTTTIQPIPQPTTTLPTKCTSSYECCERISTGWWGCANEECDPCVSGKVGCVDCSVKTTTTTRISTTTVPTTTKLTTTTTTIQPLPKICCCWPECGQSCKWANTCTELGKYWGACTNSYCEYTTTTIKTTTTVPTTTTTISEMPMYESCAYNCYKSNVQFFCRLKCRLLCGLGLC